MALTKVEDKCPICNKKLDKGPAIYITKVNLTKSGRTTPANGMSWGGTHKETPEGKMRIQHLGSSKIRMCLHQECYENKIEKLMKN